MIFGCCTEIANYDLVAKCGYTAITLAGKDIAVMSTAAFEDTLAKVKHGPLRLLSMNTFCPPEVRLTGDSFSKEKLAEYAMPLFERAERLGMKYAGIGCPKSRSLPEGYDAKTGIAQFSEALELLCTLGRPHGVSVLLEAVCDLECNLITTTTEALSLLHSLAIPDLHLVYDIYHAHMMDEGTGPILDAAGEIKVVHIAQDVANGQRHYLRTDRADEYRPYITALHQIGYTGEVALEAFFGELEVELPKSHTVLKSL